MADLAPEDVRRPAASLSLPLTGDDAAEIAHRHAGRGEPPAPLLGRDNTVILAELGYSETEQQDLKTKGVTY